MIKSGFEHKRGWFHRHYTKDVWTRAVASLENSFSVSLWGSGSHIYVYGLSICISISISIYVHTYIYGRMDEEGISTKCTLKWETILLDYITWGIFNPFKQTCAF